MINFRVHWKKKPLTEIVAVQIIIFHAHWRGGIVISIHGTVLPFPGQNMVLE